MSPKSLLILLVCLISHYECNALVSLRTVSSIKGTSPQQVFDFLATPSNWPTFVLSSVLVEGSNVDKPLVEGDLVEEVFGLPPILPLRVAWTCVESDARRGKLDVVSPRGVDGLASDCRMLFDIQESVVDKAATATTIDLVVEYEPQSILGRLAAPVLTMDNTLALQVFLPRAMKTKLSEALDDFYKLMGSLYGIAGLLHLVDCLVDSKLLVAAGAPTFYDLPVAGQSLALLWCAAGPFCFWASRVGLGWLGLVVYGVVEVFGAGIASTMSSPTAAATMDPLTNALVVQAVVALSWWYSFQKQQPNQEERG